MQHTFLQGSVRCDPSTRAFCRGPTQRCRARPTPFVPRAQGHSHYPEEQEAEELASTSYSPAARRAYAQIVAPSRIGAEYGEGFLQFRPGGEPRRLDVAAMNEQLKAGGALRMRFQQRPDEAYGTVFDFDAVIADTAGAYRRAWGRVAAQRGLRLHPMARLSMHNTAPERIIMDVLGWTSSMREARALAFELAEAYSMELQTLGCPPARGATAAAAAAASPSSSAAASTPSSTLGSADGTVDLSNSSVLGSVGDVSDGVGPAGGPDAASSSSGGGGGMLIAGGPHPGEAQPGVRDWLTALTSFNVPVALVSALDRATVRRALERMHLHDHFSVLVTAEDELESTAQRYLSAALQMRRPPNMCAVFGATPEAITAAHNCTMKAVAVAVSPDYPAYKLRSADVTVASLADLTVYNLRRLFANSGDEFMDLRKQRSDDRPRNKRRTANAML